MSGNSCESCLQTAPIVSDLTCLGGSSGPGLGAASPGAVSSATATSARQVGQFVLADLQLVAVLELVRVDPAAVDVGAVQGAGVVQVPRAGAPHEDRMVARHGHVVQEDLSVGRAADRQPLALQRK